MYSREDLVVIIKGKVPRIHFYSHHLSTGLFVSHVLSSPFHINIYIPGQLLTSVLSKDILVSMSKVLFLMLSLVKGRAMQLGELREIKKI